MTSICAICQQKGGVGKTTETLGLASAAATRGMKVLVVDMDPQANASRALGVDAPDFTINDALMDGARGAAAGAISETGWENVWCVPAEQVLENRERDGHPGVERMLSDSLDTPEILDVFDLILIDCRPTLGMLTRNALTAANKGILVVEPSTDANRGLGDTWETVLLTAKHYNQALDVAGIVVNLVPPSGKEAGWRIAEVEENVPPETLWRPFIPRRAILNEARGAQRAIHTYGARGRDIAAIFDAHLSLLLGETSTDNHPAHATQTEDGTPA